MKKMSTLAFIMIMGISMMFGLTASANPAIVSYGGNYTRTIAEGETAYSFILPNAKTTGTSVKLSTSAVNSLQIHYYWSYNNTTIDLGTSTVSGTYYNGGSGYYQPGTLVTVVERVSGSTTITPLSFTISFN
ncbi:hypothetical protein [Paenibacillus monticola]|uniref:Uncharacterized protein n=1 Tax=Paenibacillus monticola TaxID=2666075 RepID=A0A7X2L1I0_9BACL|nr:hypothetical protein [Paenibacillus monticola]MRN52326.1 hypothetical protein [Paenibacillus monticola]